MPTTDPELIATTWTSRDENSFGFLNSHLTVGLEMIQQLKLNGSDVAEVERLEEEEDELALPVLEVEGGGGAVAQARHLQEKVMW